MWLPVNTVMEPDLVFLCSVPFLCSHLLFWYTNIDKTGLLKCNIRKP